MNDLTWKCHACGQERPDGQISVHTVDLSDSYRLPLGTMKMNVRYCNDRPECVSKAREARSLADLSSQPEAKA